VSATGKKIVGTIAVVVVLVLVIIIWDVTHRPTGPITDPTQNISDFDQFQKDLAARVLNLFGGGSDFSAVVATTAYPIGTLLRASGSVPANLEDCVPKALPKPFSAQRLFPSYTLSTDTALAANLGGEAIQGLDSAGVNLRQIQSVRYEIADTQVQIMDDKSVAQVTGEGSCGTYISAHPGIRLIRGAVIGKMTFTIKVDNPASVKAQLAKIGSFTINDDPRSSLLSIADQQDEPIVELLSEFAAGSGAASPLTTPPPVERPVPAPVEQQQQQQQQKSNAHIFVQMDANDNASSGAKLVQLLRTEWPTANVESQAERIPTQKMPALTQVRYFNASDVAIANRCASILKPVYGDVQVVRVGLPSPKGQLEVWLSKKA
jgi:hypothetical protein